MTEVIVLLEIVVFIYMIVVIIKLDGKWKTIGKEFNKKGKKE